MVLKADEAPSETVVGYLLGAVDASRSPDVDGPTRLLPGFRTRGGKPMRVLVMVRSLSTPAAAGRPPPPAP
jgi:hypothetical protein